MSMGIDMLDLKIDEPCHFKDDGGGCNRSRYRTSDPRGDCEHAIGLPGKSIPGQHDGHDDTVDVHGKPNGWCWNCWNSFQIQRFQIQIEKLKDIITAIAGPGHIPPYRDYTEEDSGVKDDSGGEISASEVLYAFCGWLTGRYKPMVMGAKFNAAPVAEAIAEFCKINNLAEPRDKWEKKIHFPPNSSKPIVDQTNPIKQVLSCLSGDLNYDNVAKAKEILKTLSEC